MIETMKKVSVVCLASDKEATVQTMQRLGSLHVMPAQMPASEQFASASSRQAQLQRAMETLASLKLKQEAPLPEGQAEDALAKTLDAIRTQEDAAAEQDSIRKDLELLRPWGSFNPEAISRLEAKGLHVRLCVTDSRTFQRGLDAEAVGDATVCKISGDGRNVHIALLSLTPFTDTSLPPAPLPDCTDETTLKARLAKALEAEQAARTALETLAKTALPALRNLQARTQDDLAFLAARDGMGDAGVLAYINGYIPERRLDTLLAEGRKSGWAIRYEAVAEDDADVPTLLNIPRRFALAQSIFDCVGILPGYFETDVSIAMFLFLALFCGMLIGDAGYGAILSLLTWLFLRKAKATAARNGLKVLFTLSLCTLAFGWLSGNWFGIPSSKVCIPFSGLPWLSEDTSQNHIKMLCFFIGAVHTSLAHAWCAYKARNSIRDVIGNLGWALFLWANFLAVTNLVAGGIPGADGIMRVLYIIGFLAILACGINWKSLGDVIYSPFSFINSFVDILSYIRLFAVGLSGVYIADSFNQMAMSIWDANPWFIPLGLLVLFIGHLLNIAMASLSILVHGIRLNTLEFSGHIGLTWSGKPYQPLKHATDENAA